MGIYRQIGPFLYGDTRFLYGGSSGVTSSYSDTRTRVNKDQNAKNPSTCPESSLHDQMIDAKQQVSCGKSGYHGNRQNNVFVTESDLEFPTAGIEVETVMRTKSGEYARKFTKSVYSNWFHAESDGSLDAAHGGTYGYELVTSVLPARIYRDIEVWTGFQNLITPLLHSYATSETGLHVHVGMEWFENTKLPALGHNTVMAIGKIITSRLYYSVIPRSFAQRVFLRNSDLHFCHETNLEYLTSPLVENTGYQIIDDAVSRLCRMSEGLNEWSMIVLQKLSDCECTKRSIEEAVYSVNDTVDASSILNVGHCCELNSAPRLTLEFRRGKGTTNALSIHRMIELCVLTVMYSGHVIDNPGEIVSPRKYMSYVIENTKSSALRSLAEKELNKCV